MVPPGFHPAGLSNKTGTPGGGALRITEAFRRWSSAATETQLSNGINGRHPTGPSRFDRTDSSVDPPYAGLGKVVGEYHDTFLSRGSNDPCVIRGVHRTDLRWRVWSIIVVAPVRSFPDLQDSSTHAFRFVTVSEIQRGLSSYYASSTWV